MNLYLGARFLHILGAVICLGAVVCLPVLAAAWRRHAPAPELERALDRLVGAGGWALVLSGLGLLYLRGWSDVGAFWFTAALGVLGATLVLEKLAEWRGFGMRTAWTWIRAGLYVTILGMMVFKP